MRIAVVDNLPEGGAKRVVYEQIKYLSQHHDVWYGTGEATDHFDWQGLPIKRESFHLSVGGHRGWKRPLQELDLLTGLRRAYRKMVEKINAWEADVVIVHPDRYTQAPWILSLAKCPRVYYGHEWLRLVYEPELFPIKDRSYKTWYEHGRRRMLKRIDRQNIWKATWVVVNSHYTAKHFYRAYGVDTEVIHPGVDTKTFIPSKRRGKGNYFLFVGERDVVHGYDLFAEAIMRSPVPVKTRIVAFKDGGFGFDEAEMVQIYQGAVAVCCLDRYEPFGLVPLEAMACAVPVIAVNQGGYRETVQAGRTGLLIERSAEALYAAMHRLAANEAERRLMGNAGRERAVKLFGWKRHGIRLDRVIEELV